MAALPAAPSPHPLPLLSVLLTQQVCCVAALWRWNGPRGMRWGAVVYPPRAGPPAALTVCVGGGLRRRRGQPGQGRRRWRYPRRGRSRAAARSQVLDPPALLADPDVGAAPGGQHHRCGGWRRRGGVGPQGIVQDPLRSGPQVGGPCPSGSSSANNSTCQRASAAVEFSVTEAHLPHQAQRPRGTQSYACGVPQVCGAAQGPTAAHAGALLTGDGVSELCDHFPTDRHLQGGEGGKDGGEGGKGRKEGGATDPK